MHYKKLELHAGKDCFIVHPKDGDSFYPQNEEARNWVRAHLPQITKSKPSYSKEKKKYLIGNWYSAAGYEAPAVIFITKKLDDPSNATLCQRAKAKLVIYHAPNLINF